MLTKTFARFLLFFFWCCGWLRHSWKWIEPIDKWNIERSLFSRTAANELTFESVRKQLTMNESMFWMIFLIFFPFSTLKQRQWVTFESVIGWLASTHRPYGAKHEEPRSFEIPSFCLDDFVCVVSSCSKQVDALHSHLRIGMSNDIISADEPSEKRWRQRQQRANCDCDRTVSADWMMRRRLINSQIWLLCH